MSCQYNSRHTEWLSKLCYHILILLEYLGTSHLCGHIVSAPVSPIRYIKTFTEQVSTIGEGAIETKGSIF